MFLGKLIWDYHWVEGLHLKSGFAQDFARLNLNYSSEIHICPKPKAHQFDPARNVPCAWGPLIKKKPTFSSFLFTALHPNQIFRIPKRPWPNSEPNNEISLRAHFLAASAKAHRVDKRADGDKSLHLGLIQGRWMGTWVRVSVTLRWCLCYCPDVAESAVLVSCCPLQIQGQFTEAMSTLRQEW